MHNNTHSVYNRLLKLWRVRLLPQWPCCYVPSPPLSGANCRPFHHSRGPGPPVPKMDPFSPGSTHTSSPLSATVDMCVVGNFVTSVGIHSRQKSKV